MCDPIYFIVFKYIFIYLCIIIIDPCAPPGGSHVGGPQHKHGTEPMAMPQCQWTGPHRGNGILMGRGAKTFQMCLAWLTLFGWAKMLANTWEDW